MLAHSQIAPQSPLLPNGSSLPVRIGVGIDTSRYGHYAAFLRDDLQPAAAELQFVESTAGYAQLRQRLDQIARLLRGGTLPQAYVYPAGMRETRDLLRRRQHLVHKRVEAITHIQIINSQYNHAPFGPARRPEGRTGATPHLLPSPATPGEGKGVREGRT